MNNHAKFDPSRRRFIGAGLAGASLLAMPPLLRAQGRSLKVGVYGGFFKESFDKYIFPAFTEETGIKVQSVSEPTGAAWLVQLRNAARAGQAPADVSMISQLNNIKGARAKLWAPLDKSRLGNRKYLYDHFVQKYDNGEIFGIGGVSWYINLVTNTDVYPQAPHSWRAFWDPANKDSIGLLALPQNSFLLDITAKTYFDGDASLQSKDDILKVFNKLVEVKSNVRLWYRDEAQFQRALISGEIPMGQYYHDVATIAAGKGYPVRSTFPEEGGVMDSGSWVVSKASDKLDESLVFINYMCRPDVQTKIAKTLGSAPTVKRKHLDLTDAEFAAVSSKIPPIIPKYDMYLDKGDWISTQWTSMLTT